MSRSSIVKTGDHKHGKRITSGRLGLRPEITSPSIARLRVSYSIPTQQAHSVRVIHQFYMCRPLPSSISALRLTTCQRRASETPQYQCPSIYPTRTSHALFLLPYADHASNPITASPASSHPSTRLAYNASHTSHARTSASRTSSAPQSCRHRTYNTSTSCTRPKVPRVESWR